MSVPDGGGSATGDRWWVKVPSYSFQTEWPSQQTSLWEAELLDKKGAEFMWLQDFSMTEHKIGFGSTYVLGHFNRNWSFSDSKWRDNWDKWPTITDRTHTTTLYHFFEWYFLELCSRGTLLYVSTFYHSLYSHCILQKSLFLPGILQLLMSMKYDPTSSTNLSFLKKQLTCTY